MAAALTSEHLHYRGQDYSESCDDHHDTDLHVCRGHLVDLRVVGPGQPDHLGPGLTRGDLGVRHRLADEVTRAWAGAVVTSLGPGAPGAQCGGDTQEEEDIEDPRGSHHTIFVLSLHLLLCLHKMEFDVRTRA